jgi:hypothetical protein
MSQFADSVQKYTISLDGAKWRKSSYSNSQGNCVEVAFVKSHIAVRDSKNLQAAPLVFTPDEWKAFLNGAIDGEFTQPQSA